MLIIYIKNDNVSIVKKPACAIVSLNPMTKTSPNTAVLKVVVIDTNFNAPNQKC